MQNQFKINIESLGFEISKSGNTFNAFGRMYGGLFFEGKSYKELFSEIETYLKAMCNYDDIERNEHGDEFVVSCNKCGYDVSYINDEGLCKNCK